MTASPIARTTTATEDDQITSAGIAPRTGFAAELSRLPLTGTDYTAGRAPVRRRACLCSRSSCKSSERARMASAGLLEQAPSRCNPELCAGVDEVRVGLDAGHLGLEGVPARLKEVELGGASCRVLHPRLLGGMNRCVPASPGRPALGDPGEDDLPVPMDRVSRDQPRLVLRRLGGGCGGAGALDVPDGGEIEGPAEGQSGLPPPVGWLEA